MASKSEKFSLLKALQLNALNSVLNPDYDYHHRQLQRWYSKEFYTPLHIVEELPIEDIVTTFYECRYQELKDDDEEGKLAEEIQQLIETDEERFRREMKEQSDSNDDDEFYKKVLEEEAKKKKPKPTINLEDISNKPQEKLLDTMENPIDLPDLGSLPDIKLDFGDPLLFEKLSDWDPMGDPMERAKPPQSKNKGKK